MIRKRKLLLAPICLVLAGCTINVGSGIGESPESQTPEEARAAVAQFECQELNSGIKDFYQIVTVDNPQALEFATPFLARDNAVAAKIGAWFQLTVKMYVGLEDDATTEEFDEGISSGILALDFWDELSKTCFDSGVPLIAGNPQ
jgi:hypothetical protein